MRQITDILCHTGIQEAAFFPYAGYRSYGGSANNRESDGNYWSSRPNGTNAYYLSGSLNNNNRANGYSVRCVQDLLPCLYI